jgi:hypothetical protein
MTVEIITGSHAGALLDEPPFRRQWQELYDNCAWSTVYQHPAFVETWYRIVSFP